MKKSCLTTDQSSINDSKVLKIYVGGKNEVEIHILYLWLIVYFLENLSKRENYGINSKKSSNQLKFCSTV